MDNHLYTIRWIGNNGRFYYKNFPKNEFNIVDRRGRFRFFRKIRGIFGTSMSRPPVLSPPLAEPNPPLLNQPSLDAPPRLYLESEVMPPIDSLDQTILLSFRNR